MALRFFDGFEGYTTADFGLVWTTNNNCVISTGGREGNCATTSNGNVTKTIDNQPTWTVGFAIMFGQQFSNVIFELLDAGTVQVGLFLNMAAGTFSVQRNGAAVTMATQTAVNFPVNTWHFIEVTATIGTSVAANSCQVRFDGQVVASVAAGQSLQATANAYASSFAIGGPSGVNVSIDDVYACDGTGTSNNSFLGNCQSQLILPDAAGDLSQWTAYGATPNFACVDQAAEDGDTTSVYSATAGTYDSYKYASLTNNLEAVFGVCPFFCARADSAATHTFASSLRIGGVSYDGAAASLGNSYQFYPTIWPANPATGVAFTASDLAAGTFQAGPKLVS